MLRQTKEFKHFAGFVEDSGGQVRILQKAATKDEPSNTQSKGDQATRSGSKTRSSSIKANKAYSKYNQSIDSNFSMVHKPAQQTNQNPILIDDNVPVDDELAQENWIPNQAYSLAHSFRKQHGDELSFDLINDMLRDLNNIYREREKKQIARIKAQSKEEINHLKRKLSYRTPFDEVCYKKNMSSLKGKLQKLEQEAMKNEKKKNTHAPTETPLDMVENTLHLVTQMQIKRKQMQAENESLKDNLVKLQEVQDNEVHDKQKFMEGAVWMGRRMSGEIERVCQVFETLAQDYSKRFGDLEKAYLNGVPLQNQKNDFDDKGEVK